MLEYETMVDYLNDEDFCLDIFEMLVDINELARGTLLSNLYDETSCLSSTQ